MNIPLLTLTHMIAGSAGVLGALTFFKRKPQSQPKERQMSFIGFLDKVGADIKKDAGAFFGKVLPVVVKAAALAEPIVDLALPLAGPIYNKVVSAVLATEQGYAALGVTGTTEQKVAAALVQVQDDLLPALLQAGLDSATANQVMTEYITAIATILNGPASGASTASAPAAPAVPAAPAPALAAPAATTAAAAEPASAPVTAAPAAKEKSGLAPA